MDNQFVSPTGYIDLDNDCQYSIDVKSTRSRESVDPKTDLAFYFNTYIEPKYGLGNINVNNWTVNLIHGIPTNIDISYYSTLKVEMVTNNIYILYKLYKV